MRLRGSVWRRRSAGRVAVLLALASAVAACGGDATNATALPPTGGGTTIASSTLSGRIVSAYFMPYPEGSVVVRYRTAPADGSASASVDVTTGFDAFVAALGWPMPEPLAQPRACEHGAKNYTVVVVLDSGQQQHYGPCVRPALVEQAAALLHTGFA